MGVQIVDLVSALVIFPKKVAALINGDRSVLTEKT